MAVPSNDSGSSPSLFVSLRSFWGVLLAILYTRFDLLTAELEDEAIRAVRMIVISLAGLLAAGMTVFFFFFLIIASFWYTAYRLPILGLVAGLCLLATIILSLVARNLFRSRPKFLSQTLAELRRDVEGLRPSSPSKSDEVKP
jgi:uncharacterized membrane protein YqjE